MMNLWLEIGNDRESQKVKSAICGSFIRGIILESIFTEYGWDIHRWASSASMYCLWVLKRYTRGIYKGEWRVNTERCILLSPAQCGVLWGSAHVAGRFLT